MDWSAAMPVGRENSFTPMGEIEQPGIVTVGAARQAGWRRLVGLLLVLIMLLPVIGVTVVLIARLS